MGKKIIRNENSYAIVSMKELFTDREQPRKAFWDKYDAMQNGEYDVISYYGVGGVGKSALLRKLGQEIEDKTEKKKLDYTYYSFECQPTKEEFLYSLSRKMMIRNKGLSFPLFDTALAKIVEEGQGNLASLEEKGNSIFSSEVADIVTNVVGVYIPWAETIKQTAEGVVKISNKIKTEWEKEKGANRVWYSNIAYNDGKAASENLHKYFVKDAFEVFEKRDTPYVIFLDGYEKFVNRLLDGDKADTIDYWMYEELEGLIYLPNTIWVIAGRNRLHWPEEVISEDSCFRIGDLSEEDTTIFLEKAGINDKELGKELYVLTQGTPAFLDLCVDTFRKVSLEKKPCIEDFGRNTEKLAQRYLDCMDSSKQKVLRMLSCFPNVWTNDLAEKIAERLGYGSIKMVLDDILPLSIFETFQEGNRLHETVREVVRRNTNNREEIEQEILKYAYERILKEDLWDERRKFIRLFDSYIICDKCGIFSESELAELIDVVAKEIRVHGDIKLGEEYFMSLNQFFKKSDYSKELTILVRNHRIENLYRLGKYREGIEYGEKTRDIAQKELGENHLQTLNSFIYLGKCYCKNGQYAKALQIDEESYQRRKDLFGIYDLMTINSLENVANDLMELEQYEEALQSAIKCYEIRKEKLGEDNVDTITIYNTVGLIYSKMGEYEKCRNIYNSVYEKRMHIFGEKNPETLISMNDISVAYFRLGKYEKAKEIDEKCYELKCEVLGENHPSTLITYNNLGHRYIRLGDYNKALCIFEDSYSRKIESLGENNPSTITGLLNIAEALWLVGEYEKAEKMAKDCLKKRMEIYGKNSTSTMFAMYYLSEIYLSQNKIEDALSLMEECCQSKLNKNNDNNVYNMRVKYGYGKIHYNAGNYEKALDIEKECLEHRIKGLGEKHFDTLFSINLIGKIYCGMEQYDKALEYVDKSFRLRKETLGEKHPETLESMYDLGIIYWKVNCKNKAIELIRSCLDYRIEILGEHHPDTIKCNKTLNFISESW